MKRMTLATVAAAFAAFTLGRANLSRRLHQGRAIQDSIIDLFADRLSLMVS